MKNNSRIFISLLFLFTTIFYSCSEPVSPDEVDPQLIGEWYYTINNSSTYPSPQTYFFGIQITADKKVKSLGIETNTGKVAIINNSYKKIIKANKWEIIWEVFYEGFGPVTETYAYRLENEKLILSKQNQNYIYTKTSLRTQLFEPVISNFSVKTDTILYENLKISPYPSAYVGKNSISEILLYAEMYNARLNIELNNFRGIGSYEIPTDKFTFQISHGDAVFITLLDSLSTGDITITQFDEANNICSGTFYVNTTILDNPDSIISLFKEGKFTVPVYK